MSEIIVSNNETDVDARAASVAAFVIKGEIDWDALDVDLQVRRLQGETNPRSINGLGWLVGRYKGPLAKRKDWDAELTIKNIKSFKKMLKLDEQEARLQGRNRRATPEQTAFVWFREKGSCGYCFRAVDPRHPGLQADHIVPWVAGGKTLVENLVCSCTRCNKAKGQMDPVEFMDLKFDPSRREEMEELYQLTSDSYRRSGSSYGL